MNQRGRPAFVERFFRWLFRRQTQGRVLVVLAVLATLVAAFYLEENWRGKRAWENCKRELEAKGAVLDWDKYIPPPVPDDQNFFTASTNIMLRFHKAQTPEQSDAAAQLQWLRFSNNPVVVAEVTVISSNSNAAPGNADLYLRYHHSVLTVGTSREDLSEPQSPLLPRFDMKAVPLKSAIERTAQAAKLNYTIDPNVKSVDSKGDPIRVTIGWKNVTARQALLALLDNFGLVLVEDSKTGIARILPKKGQIYAEAYATKEINRVLSSVLEPGTNGFQGAGLKGAVGVWFFAKSSRPIRPAHIVVWANQIPNVQEMCDIFSKNTAKSIGTNSFRIYGNPQAMSAADYLAWSDQYVPAFDEIREALKRPYAIIPGDYSTPYLIPIPNFVTMRSVAQTLAQRAQCDFLLDQPDKALRELTLMHDICRILERPPAGKPITLVEAMINVAISGLYAATVAEGLRLHAWQEPQLAAIQEQLKEINLPSSVVSAFESEPAATTHTLENISTAKLKEWFQVSDGQSSGGKISLWQKIRNLKWVLIPHGWIYQNMATSARLVHQQTEGCDSVNGLIQPQKFGDLTRELDAIAGPYKFIAAEAIPNFAKAWQTTAHNQTIVNEAQIVCALERFRLAKGDYPETLEALAPQFIETIPHDLIGGEPLRYRRTDDGKFLLYSIGWNEKDDGGITAKDKSGNDDRTQGDWVWQYPQK